jgi:DUF3037 family protein
MVKESELKECSYFLVRYVPDVTREEFINIGVLLSCPGERFLDCAFSDDWRRINRFHGHADAEFLKDLQSHFKQQIEEHKNDLNRYIGEMQQSYSNLIQLSEARPCLTSNLPAQLQDLFERYVGARAASPTERDSRIYIRQRMTDCFSRYGILGHKSFERRIPASQWTGVGDPFTFDFGYKPQERAGQHGGRLKLIHAISLERDPKLTEVLVWTFERVLAKEPSVLTVGHEDDPHRDNPQVRFALSVLQHEHIHLVPVSGFDAYAQSIRAELAI